MLINRYIDIFFLFDRIKVRELYLIKKVVIYLLVTLVGKNSIYKIVLPQLAVGNYWICDDNGKKYVK